MTDAEKAALEWLDKWGRAVSDPEGKMVATLKAMLAQPRLPKEPTTEIHEIFKRAGHGWMFEFGAFAAGYRALYAHLAPVTISELEKEDEERMG